MVQNNALKTDVSKVSRPLRSARAAPHLDDEYYRQLQIALMLRPEQGPVIQGSGGLRKVRWATTAGANARTSGHLLLGAWRSGVLHGVCLHQVRTGRLDAGTDPPTQSSGAGGIQMKDAAFQELLTSVR